MNLVLAAVDNLKTTFNFIRIRDSAEEADEDE
jgi:hypothetical protein